MRKKTGKKKQLSVIMYRILGSVKGGAAPAVLSTIFSFLLQATIGTSLKRADYLTLAD